MKRHYSVVVRGNWKTWSFDVSAEPEHVEQWREDGLEVDEVLNTIPVWVAKMGLTRAWCFLQDLWHLRFSWSRHKKKSE